ncbi:hypothetical protein ABFP36_23345, partial [Salmonella enterica subsp. enterica serovar Kentucky]
GDKPGACAKFRSSLLCSPRQRGYTGTKLGWYGKSGVFPAPAGINRQPTPKRRCIHGVPRASGDKPAQIFGG